MLEPPRNGTLSGLSQRNDILHIMLYNIFKKEVHIMQKQQKDSIHLNKSKLPLSFIKNNGQEDQRAHFTTNYKGRRFFFSSERITFVELEPLEKQVPEPGHFPDDFEEPNQPRNGVALELSFTNANSGIIAEGVSQQEGYHHYLKGNDSSKWQNEVPHYKELRYNSVWESVDLEIYGGEGGLKMNWLIDKPESVSSIRLHWEGADRLEIDEVGNLLIHHALGTLTDLAPIAYQGIDGVQVPVNCAYQLYDGFDFGFELTGDYSAEVPIIIDPILQYVTYLGGSAEDIGQGIAVDGEGHAYVTGYTYSLDFPVTPGAFQTTNAGSTNVFITKFSSDGGSLIYSTYLGGSSVNMGSAISLDTQNCAYVTGITNTSDFPTTPGAFQTTGVGIFVTKLAADGESLVYSTYLGNQINDIGPSIDVDLLGCAYVVGATVSNAFPTTPGAFQTSIPPSATRSGFVTKFSADGVSLIYSTFLTGDGNNYCTDIDLDAYGYAYVTGLAGDNFPVTPGAFYSTASNSSAFVTKLSIDGSSLTYSSVLGGNVQTNGYGIVVDSQGSAYVVGDIASGDYPVTPNAFQTTFGGGYSDTFVSKLSPSGDSLIGSTGGGNNNETGTDIALDKQGRAYVTGVTSSPNFPTKPNVVPSTLMGVENSFISIFSADLTNLLVSYYLGGNSYDSGYGIALGSDGAVYSTGYASSTNFPVTPGAYQTTNNGYDAYATKTAFAFYNKVSLNLVKLQ